MLLTASPGMIWWLNAFINPLGGISKTHCFDPLDIVVLLPLAAMFLEKVPAAAGLGLVLRGPAECCALWERTTLTKPLIGGDQVHPVCELSPDQSLDPQVYVQASLLPSLTTERREKMSPLLSYSHRKTVTMSLVLFTFSASSSLCFLSS